MRAHQAVLTSLFGSLLAIATAPACALDHASIEAETEVDVEALGKPLLAQQVAQARAATAKYHDVAVAVADGFVSTGVCAEVPVLGAIGVHYVNQQRLFDPAVSIDEPEILIYLPQDGEPKLVAVEYFQAVVIEGAPYAGCGVENPACPPANAPPPPQVFDGETLEGPMPGHQPGIPWHYDTNVWLWANNPAGMFATFNPSLSCE
jgi:hypothetical protein